MLVALSVAMVAILAVGGSLAYFSDQKEANNYFSVGNVKIELTEPGWESSGKLDAPGVYPGEPLKKDPTVKNVGANPCFVRIRIEGLDTLIPATIPTGKTADDYMIRLRTGTSNAGIGVLGTDWVDGGDGYYYYKKVLVDDAVNGFSLTTTPLCNYIIMPTAIENGYEWDWKTVKVTAQAVQAQLAKPSFAAVKTMTVPEIISWFGTCGL